MIKRRLTTVLTTITLSLLCLTAQAQCPEVGYDRASHNPRYVANGWDTAITCDVPGLILAPDFTCTAMIMNGQYRVDPIPYNPPDTTFRSISGGGSRLPITADDQWDAAMTLPFPFNFFGTNYFQAFVGGNGVVTFNTNNIAGTICYWPTNGTSATIPSPNLSSSNPITNAIYGMYEDVYPPTISSHPNYGIFKSIYDAYPCRKLVVSYNNIPGFQDAQAGLTAGRVLTSQIVCYEGTNIIEVHVKKRTSRPWNGSSTNGVAYIGIENAAGNVGFAAPGRNPLGATSDITTPEAWRFTPLGDTIINFMWYRGEDTIATNQIRAVAGDPNNPEPGNDTLVMLNDTLNQGGNHHGTLIIVPSRLTVQNITHSQAITVRMIFTSAGVRANGGPIIYDMSYTFHIGVDKDKDFTLTPRHRKRCRNERDTIDITIPENATAPVRKIEWNFTDGSYNGATESRIRQALSPQGNTGVDSTSTSIYLNNYNWPYNTTRFKDTVIVIANVTFENGCTNSDTVHLYYVNNVNVITDTHTCEGVPFLFHGQEFSETNTYNVRLDTMGCPYSAVLKLSVKDTDFIVWPYKDCHPYTWGDSTYTESTNAPSFTFKNKWGCDSTVNLHFTMDKSLKAIIEATPNKATLDNLNIAFKDVSLASAKRKWILPDGSNSTDVTTYYNFPTSQDSITTMLIAISNFGCEDTTSVTIPLLKESIWFPNAFTPNREENPYYLVKGIGVVSLHVDIYNRNGILVGGWDGIDGHWDGLDYNGEPCPQGAYVYIAKYTTVINPQNPITKKGTILLIR